MTSRFQSSPGPWAECNNRDVEIPQSLLFMFQSSPGPWAECNTRASVTSMTMLPLVEFQSSPGPWAECNGVHLTVRFEDPTVSILTRPVGRVQQPEPLTVVDVDTLFQSSPGPWAECN